MPDKSSVQEPPMKFRWSYVEPQDFGPHPLDIKELRRLFPGPKNGDDQGLPFIFFPVESRENQEVSKRLQQKLTQLQLKICCFAIYGYKHRKIATLLQTTESVVKQLSHKIFDKVGAVNNQLDLALFLLTHQSLYEAGKAAYLSPDGKAKRSQRRAKR